MATRTYDPAQILCTFLGNQITGFADGTFVKASRTDDAFALMVGAGGEAARARSQNRSGSVTFTLLQTSPVNDVLTAAAEADALSGTGIGPLLIKDNLGTTLVLAENAWIKKIPDIEFAKEIGNREWTIECADLEMKPGGAT